jgi:hypothetical protein
MMRVLDRTSLALLTIGLRAIGMAFRRGSARLDDSAHVLTHLIASRDLDVKVSEHGTVGSSSHNEIKCMVKGCSKVLWVSETGTMIRPGDLRVRLDQSQIEDNSLAKQITYERTLASVLESIEDPWSHRDPSLSNAPQERTRCSARVVCPVLPSQRA